MNQLYHLFRTDCCFILCLCRRHEIQTGVSLVLDQSLFNSALSFNHVYQIINNPVFQPHDHIQISQSDVCVDQYNTFAHGSKTCSNVCGCGGLPHSAFP